MASGKSATKSVDKTRPRPGLEITSKRESFWRCGRQFFRHEPVTVPVDDLTEGQLERLREDPELVVQDVEIPAEPVAAEAK